jgi:hypothetical protein
MAAFLLSKTDARTAGDKMAAMLSERVLLGAGEHYVLLCSGISGWCTDKLLQHNLLLVHSGNAGSQHQVPETIGAAIQTAGSAAEWRASLGSELAAAAGAGCEMLADLPHSYVEADDRIVYRKGCIRAHGGKLHFMVAHTGAKIWAYTVDEYSMPPADSLPCCTGIAEPHSPASAQALHASQNVYFPAEQSSAELNCLHPSRRNSYEQIISLFGGGKYIVPVGEAEILCFIGLA